MDQQGSNATSESAECWHCSLVKYQVSYLSAEEMHHFAGYILPGVIFSVLGLRWALQLALEWSKTILSDRHEASGLPPAPASQLGCRVAFTLPWEGIIKLALTGIGIIVSVIAANPQADGEYVSNLRYATIYFFFALSGLMDVLVYYCGYVILPEGIQSLILALAFLVEGLMMSLRLRFESYLEQQLHLPLVVAVLACAGVCIMEVLHDNRLVKFSRAYLCLIQGTWFIHAGFIMQGSGTGESNSYPDSLEWVSILFSWHVAANFIVFVTGLLLAKRVVQEAAGGRRWSTGKADPGLGSLPSSSPTRSSASFPSSPATTVVAMSSSPDSFQAAVQHQHHQSREPLQQLGLPTTTYSYQSKQLPSPPLKQGSGMSLVPPSFRQPRYSPPAEEANAGLPQATEDLSRPGSKANSSPVTIVEALPKDHVMLSEEYRTLSREDELRASIKLKESSLI